MHHQMLPKVTCTNMQRTKHMADINCALLPDPVVLQRMPWKRTRLTLTNSWPD